MTVKSISNGLDFADKIGIATYQAAMMDWIPERGIVNLPLAEVTVDDLDDVNGGAGRGEDLLSFTLTGELVMTLTAHEARNNTQSAHHLEEDAMPTVGPATSLGTRLDDMLGGVVCGGVTVVNDAGFPTFHDHGSVLEIRGNRMIRTDESQVRTPECPGLVAEDVPVPLVLDSHLEVANHPTQLDELGEILNSLPEHIRCVMPSVES